MSEQIQELQQRLRELERTYLEKRMPITALKIAGSRMDELVSSGEKTPPGLVEKASLALDQAGMVAGFYSSNNLTEAFSLTTKMRMALHEDYPQHYLVQD